MILVDVMDEIETTLKTITGLHVYGWATAAIRPPGAIVTLPESIAVRADGRGLDVMRMMSVVVMVSRSTDRTAIRQLSPYVSSTGVKSVPAVLEAHTPVAYDVLEVDSIELSEVEHAGVPYLGAMININITGRGGTP